MSTIVTRAGKGSPLTNAEVDANFTNLNTDKVEVVGAPSDGQAVIWDATSSQWVPGAVDALPSQTGNEGKFLTTDGTDPAWAAVDALPSQTGNDGNTLRTDGTNAYWAPTVNITSQRQIYTATDGQTVFSATYDVGYVDVYLNGVKLVVETDFTATTGTTIVLTTGAVVGDTVDIIGYGTSLIAIQFNRADGGFANSVYTTAQSINGGAASG